VHQGLAAGEVVLAVEVLMLLPAAQEVVQEAELTG